MLTDLPTLATRLMDFGPIRTLSTPKRIRILLNHHFIADTTCAQLIWEHAYYPVYYIPLASLRSGPADITTVRSLCKGAEQLLLQVGDRQCHKVISFTDGAAEAAKALRGYVHIPFDGPDAWYEEDTRIYVHPKDPYKRIDIVHSTRPVKVLVGGKVVAETTSSYHLYETGLPRRFYLPPTAVEPSVLRPSETTTQCPYKGVAEYYSVQLEEGGEVWKDVVWYYRTPTLESAPVAGLLCFYNEKVEIEVDGERLEKVKSPFA